MLDPLFIRVAALGFSILFCLSALHKLSNRIEFLLILDAYKILPPMLLRPVTLILPNVELVLAFGWLLMGTLGYMITAVPLFSALILSIYGAAIAINLLRGSREINCGCSFASAKAEKSKGSEKISAAMVWRNSVLALLSLTPALPVTSRDIGGIDYLALVCATIVCVFIYAAMNQLIANNQSMKRRMASQGS